MAIHTSSITYTRGIPKNYNNFFLIAQANNTIIQPMSLYMNKFNYYNRNVTPTTSTRYTFPWKK